jgi:hypothetical protein
MNTEAQAKHSASDVRLADTLNTLLARASAVSVLMGTAEDPSEETISNAAWLIEDLLTQAQTTVDTWWHEAKGAPSGEQEEVQP